MEDATTSSFSLLLWYSFVALIKVIVIAAFGSFFARYELISSKAKKDLSNLVFYLFTPCLLFGSVSTTVDAASLLRWWPLVAFPMVWQVLAYVSGRLLAACLVPALPSASSLPLLSSSKAPVAQLQRSKREEVVKCLVSSLVFWNAGNLPLSMIISITRDIEPFASDPTATSRGVAYTSICMTYLSIMVWSVAYNYLRPVAPPPSSPAEPEPKAAARGRTSCEVLESTDMDGTALLIASSASDKAATASPWLLRLFKELCTPATVSLAIALVVGLISPLRSVFHGAGAPLKFVSDLTSTLGLCAVPIILIVLGTSFSNGPQTLRIGKRVVVCMIVLKLVVLPAIGVGMVWMALRWGLLPDDPLFALCLVVQAASPSATALVVIAELLDNGSDMMASLQFWQYLAAMGSIPLFIALSLRLFLG